MRARGFTLLEVMVAVAILGLGLTAILSAQTGVFASSAHARNLSVATGLARAAGNAGPRATTTFSPSQRSSSDS